MFDAAETAEVRLVTAWLVPQARRLEAALRPGAAWPAMWRGSAHECRVLMAALCLRLVPDADVRFLDPFRQALGDYSDGPASTMRVRDPWDAVRMMSSPASRRALLWATLWYFAMPTDEQLWPVWLRRGDRYGGRPPPGTPTRDDPRFYRSLDALVSQYVLLSNPARRREQRPREACEAGATARSRVEESLQRRFGIVPSPFDQS
jgi:hypothetical protein